MTRARFAAISAGAAFALFIAMMLCLELGRQIGLRQPEALGTALRTGVGVVDGAVSAVLALLLGFVFSGATARFDQRRQLIAHQVSAINNAWLRMDSLPADSQPGIRDAFRRFVDSLIAAYTHDAGSDESLRHESAVIHARKDVWSRSIAACLAPEGERSRMLVLPSLNEMFTAVEEERLARRIHPAGVIYAMLVLAALVSALLAGYTMANTETRNWLLHIALAGVVTVVMYVIVQIEYPRLGIIRVDVFDRVLVELRATFG